MKRIKSITLSLGLCVLTSTFLLLGYQKCSQPISDFNSDFSNPSPGGPLSLSLQISQTYDGMPVSELDYNKAVHFKVSGFKDNQIVEGCTEINNGYCSDYEEVGRATNGVFHLRYQAVNLATPSSGVTSYSYYFGKSFRVNFRAKNANGSVSKTFYIRPPHFSQDATDIAVWASFDEEGMDRITDGGTMYQVRMSATQPHYVHLYNPTGEVIELCSLLYSGAAPLASECSSSDWRDPTEANHTEFPYGQGDKRWVRWPNPNGFPFSGKFVQFFRKKNGGVVYNHLTTYYNLE